MICEADCNQPNAGVEQYVRLSAFEDDKLRETEFNFINDDASSRTTAGAHSQL